MSYQKPLRDMSPDEIAQLPPDTFQALAHDHNDHLELRENAYERVIVDSNDPANYSDHPTTEQRSSALPNPDHEIDKVLDGLVQQIKPESFLRTIIDAVKAVPAQVRDRRQEIVAIEQSPAMKELIPAAEALPPELFDALPSVNDWETDKKCVMHGVPDPADPCNPLKFRDASDTSLEGLANRAWGMTLGDAIAEAARKNRPAEGEETKRNRGRQRTNERW